MTPYLVLVRIPDGGATAEGPMLLYVAMFETEREAIDAVRRVTPSDWIVGHVVGQANPSIVQGKGLIAGDVERL